jgi:hypothetical protein
MVRKRIHQKVDAPCARVSESLSDIIRRREDGDDILLVTPIISLHHELMCARDERESIVMIELLADILSERVAGSSRRDAPAAPVVGVGPQQVTHGSLVRHLLQTILLDDVVQRVDRRGQTAVQTEDLLLDQRGQGQVIEEVGEIFPHIRIAVLAETLVVETVTAQQRIGNNSNEHERDVRCSVDMHADASVCTDT